MKFDPCLELKPLIAKTVVRSKNREYCNMLLILRLDYPARVLQLFMVCVNVLQ